MDIYKIIEEALQNASPRFDPTQQTLKGWAMFCLRDRGFKVSTSPKADFIVETRTDKIYFRLTEDPDTGDANVAWIVREPTSGRVQVIAPTQSE